MKTDSNRSPFTQVTSKIERKEKTHLRLVEKNVFRVHNANIILSLFCSCKFLLIRSCSQNQTLNIICLGTIAGLKMVKRKEEVNENVIQLFVYYIRLRERCLTMHEQFNSIVLYNYPDMISQISE